MFLLTWTIDGKGMLLNLDRVDGLVSEGTHTIAVCEGNQLILNVPFSDMTAALSAHTIKAPPEILPPERPAKR